MLCYWACWLSPARWFCCSPGVWWRQCFLKHCRRIQLLLLTCEWCAQGTLALGFLHIPAQLLPTPSMLGDAGVSSQPAETLILVGHRHPLGLGQGPAELLVHGGVCQKLPSRAIETAESSNETNQMVLLFQLYMQSTMSGDEPLKSVMLLMN